MTVYGCTISFKAEVLPELKKKKKKKKVVKLSALRTGRLYPPGNIPGTHFC
jgi:hypothetical protein